MKPKLIAMTTILLAGAAVNAADVQSADSGNATAAFSRLKSLAGEWQADTPMGKVRLKYDVIAGGTALVERETGEKMPEMLTVYHMDGQRLMLTHYCAVGNQPRMVAQSYDAGTGEVQFKFLDGTNLGSPSAAHMHNATFRLIDDDHFVSEWQFYENGRAKMSEKAQYTRVR